MPIVKVTYADGQSRRAEVEDVAALLDEVSKQPWDEREPGSWAQVVAIELDDENEQQYQENLAKLRNVRPAFGRGLGRRGPEIVP